MSFSKHNPLYSVLPAVVPIRSPEADVGDFGGPVGNAGTLGTAGRVLARITLLSASFWTPAPARQVLPGRSDTQVGNVTSCGESEEFGVWGF